MFSIGDNVYYGAHGICEIEDIQEQSFTGEKKRYYLLRSHNDSLKLYHPVETEHSKLTPILAKETAEKVLEVFKQAVGQWHERMTERRKEYQGALESADHVQIAQMVNTLMRKKMELEAIDKKLPSQDVQMLTQVAPVFYEGLAMSLGMNAEQVREQIKQTIKDNM